MICQLVGQSRRNRYIPRNIQSTKIESWRSRKSEPVMDKETKLAIKIFQRRKPKHQLVSLMHATKQRIDNNPQTLPKISRGRNAPKFILWSKHNMIPKPDKAKKTKLLYSSVKYKYKNSQYSQGKFNSTLKTLYAMTKSHLCFNTHKSIKVIPHIHRMKEYMIISRDHRNHLIKHAFMTKTIWVQKGCIST